MATVAIEVLCTQILHLTPANGIRVYTGEVHLTLKNQGFEPALVWFCLYSCGFNRPANVKLTPMASLAPLQWANFSYCSV